MMGADNYDANSEPKLGLGVGPNSTIKNSIIDKNARIGKGVYLNPEGLDEGWVDDKQNIYCKDGILVVVKNGLVEDETQIGRKKSNKSL